MFTVGLSTNLQKIHDFFVDFRSVKMRKNRAIFLSSDCAIWIFEYLHNSKFQRNSHFNVHTIHDFHNFSTNVLYAHSHSKHFINVNYAFRGKKGKFSSNGQSPFDSSIQHKTVVWSLSTTSHLRVWRMANNIAMSILCWCILRSTAPDPTGFRSNEHRE